MTIKSLQAKAHKLNKVYDDLRDELMDADDREQSTVNKSERADRIYKQIKAIEKQIEDMK